MAMPSLVIPSHHTSLAQQLGGNARAREFFQGHPDYSSTMSLSEKYNSEFAAQYREKLSAEVEGRPWTPSAITSTKRSSSSASVRSMSRPGSAASNVSRSTSTASLSRPANGNGGYGTAYGNGDGATGYMPDKVRNEQYFATLGRENENRPDNLPPNQGGKFTGFGNPAFENQSRSNTAVPDLNDIINDPMQALTKGWSLLSVGMEVIGTAAVEGARIAAHSAQEVAYMANERVVKPAQEQLNDPNLRANVAGYVSQLGKTVRVVGLLGCALEFVYVFCVDHVTIDFTLTYACVMFSNQVTDTTTTTVSRLNNMVNQSLAQPGISSPRPGTPSSFSPSSHTVDPSFNDEDFFNTTINSLQKPSSPQGSRSASPAPGALGRTGSPAPGALGRTVSPTPGPLGRTASGTSLSSAASGRTSVAARKNAAAAGGKRDGWDEEWAGW
ncbi:hypothetical protein BC936DRAFT_144590 [Jimgerdemannia flammicorona]|uniref:Uncharacterized protein n=1 Tax=Jimgerdemannia flammicorona TaxID=994334 RepID=A0A433DC70_9FUNG|nr:hypothetical protein BC936DRAFT_144590 [Jimgerdemannia flammicorona]